MGDVLRRRLRQGKPLGPFEEALLNLLVAAGCVRDRLDLACARFGLTNRQYNVLRILRGAHPGGHPRQDIAVRMIERAPDVTRLIDRLQARGLVERARTGSDRRQAIARITSRGLALLKRMDADLDAVHRIFARRLPGGEARRLSKTCEAIYGPDE